MNDRKQQLDKFFKSNYYSYINVNIFARIQKETDRLNVIENAPSAKIKSDKLKTEKLNLEAKLINQVWDAISRQAPPCTAELQNEVQQEMVKDLTLLSKQQFICEMRDPIASFFKALLGVLLAAPALFIPLVSKNYRSFFFNTTTSQAVEGIVDDMEEKWGQFSP